MEKMKNIRKKLRHQRSVRRRKLGLSTPTQIICVSFIIVIALGTLLLTLPIASRHGRLDVLNAMFTATSATCVTGLVVRDTWTQFTWFGQAVVLLLIQVGGLGLVTLTSFFALAMRRRMGFRDLRLLGESVSADGYDQAKNVLKIVVGLAAMFEGIGVLLLLFAFVPQFGLEGVWISVFTAISAFCNAGFDLFGRFGAYSSLVPYVNNYYVQAVIIFMIISGGLGQAAFFVPLAQFHPDHKAQTAGDDLMAGRRAGAGTDGVEQPRHAGRAVGARQGDGFAVPVGIHPYRRHEHRGLGFLRYLEQAADERAAIHRRSARLYRRRCEGDHLRSHHFDHPQRGAGTGGVFCTTGTVPPRP